MKAMILAAGRGERMRPLTDTCPKPLLRAGGKPLAVWHLEGFAKAGIREVVINHAHLGQMLEDALGDGSHWGLRISYSPEQEALETAGGIAQALDQLGPDAFLVVNGDVYCEMDFASVQANAGVTMLSSDILAHIVLVDNPEHHGRGDFHLDGSLVRPDREPRLTFSGVGVYRKELFEKILPGTPAKLGPLLAAAAARELVSAERFTGYWLDVGTPERLERLDARLTEPSSGTRPEQ